jgi:hypothetical protein
VYKWILSGKLLIGNRGQKTELTGKSPLRRRKTTLDYSAIEKKEAGEGELIIIIIIINNNNNHFIINEAFWLW